MLHKPRRLLRHLFLWRVPDFRCVMLYILGGGRRSYEAIKVDCEQRTAVMRESRILKLKRAMELSTGRASGPANDSCEKPRQARPSHSVAVLLRMLVRDHPPVQTCLQSYTTTIHHDAASRLLSAINIITDFAIAVDFLLSYADEWCNNC